MLGAGGRDAGMGMNDLTSTPMPPESRIRRISAHPLWLGALATVLMLGAAPVLADNPLTDDRIVPEEQIESTFGKFLAGQVAGARGDLAAATDYFHQALAEDPDSETLKSRAYRAFLTTGEVEEAIKIARDLAESEEDGGLAQFIIAIDDVGRGEYTAAAEALARVPAEGPMSLLKAIVAAWVEAGAGHHEKALEALEPLASTNGFQSFKALHTAYILDYLGLAEEAEAAYRKTVESRAARSLSAIEGFANFLIRQGRRDEAEAMFSEYVPASAQGTAVVAARQALARAGTPAPLAARPADGVAIALSATARALAQNDASQVAAGYAYLAIHLRPRFDAAYTLIGNVLEFERNWALANQAYENADPDSPYGWNARLRIATNLDRLERTEEAMAMLREMSEERPERTDALIGLADMLRYDKRWEEAVAEYDKAASRISTLGENDWTLLYSRGIALERSDQWDRAEADFLRALELRPDQPLALNYLGYSWVEMGINLDRARGMIEKAVDLRPRDGYIVDSLGWVLYQLGDYGESVRQLERAVVLRPTDPVINDHLGDAYWRVGRILEAQFQWQRALTFEPEEDEIEAIKKKIDLGLEDI